MYKNGLIQIVMLVMTLAMVTGCGVNAPEPVPALANKTPVAVISPNSEQFVFIGDTLIFSTINSYDPDASLPLTYHWTVSGSETSIQESTESTLYVSFVQAGTATVQLLVTDNAGAVSDLSEVVVNVAALDTTNRAPNGHIFYQVNDASTAKETPQLAIMTGTVITLTNTASDPDGDSITGFEWTIPPGVTTIPTTPDSGPFTATFDIAGTYDISLVVIDSLGNRDPSPATLLVTVTDTIVNQAPNGSINHNGGSGPTDKTGNFSIIIGDSVTFLGSAIDPDSGDTYTSSWMITPTTGATGVPTTDINSFTTTFDTVGDYTLSYTATDNNGNSDLSPATVTITVNNPPPNQPPNGTINHDSANGTGNISIPTGTQVTFTGSATDPDVGDIVTSYQWEMLTISATGIPVGVPIALDVTSFPIIFDNIGDYTLRLTVMDDKGNVDQSPAEVIISVYPATGNQPPSGSITTDGTINTQGNILIGIGSSLTFDSSVIDPEGDPITYAWTIDNGSGSPISNSTPGPLTVMYNTAGRFAVSLVVGDGQNNNVAIGPTPLTVVVSPLGGGGGIGGGGGGGGIGGGGGL